MNYALFVKIQCRSISAQTARSSSKPKFILRNSCSVVCFKSHKESCKSQCILNNKLKLKEQEEEGGFGEGNGNAAKLNGEIQSTQALNLDEDEDIILGKEKLSALSKKTRIITIT